jgi:hypothetical protein
VRCDFTRGDLAREVTDGPLIVARLERRHTAAGTVTVPR